MELKRKRMISGGLAVFALACVFYAYCIYHGYLLLNNPSRKQYPLWIRNVFTKPRISESWMFWQYTNRARLDGYAGDEEFIDLNVFCGDQKEWEEWVELQMPDN